MAGFYGISFRLTIHFCYDFLYLICVTRKHVKGVYKYYSSLLKAEKIWIGYKLLTEIEELP
jgi:hypothetical protein